MNDSVSDTPRTDGMFRTYVSDPTEEIGYVLKLNKEETEELFRRIGGFERDNAKLREAGNELARIVSAPPDSDYKTWPSDDEIDAAIAAWRKL